MSDSLMFVSSNKCENCEISNLHELIKSWRHAKMIFCIKLAFEIFIFSCAYVDEFIPETYSKDIWKKELYAKNL